jgi:hypothetical protein
MIDWEQYTKALVLTQKHVNLDTFRHKYAEHACTARQQLHSTGSLKGDLMACSSLALSNIPQFLMSPTREEVDRAQCWTLGGHWRAERSKYVARDQSPAVFAVVVY